MTLEDDRTEQLLQRYIQTQVETASPIQRLLMIQQRLVQDLHAAEDGFNAASIEAVHVSLVHAQEIVLVLRDSLAGSDWAGAEPLRSVYWFVYHRLIECNMTKDRSLLPLCVRLIEQVVDANTQAAAKVALSVEAGAVQVA